ncbi:hypothetical protein Hanom_Chr13g01222661 [Helianthus anomalus]
MAEPSNPLSTSAEKPEPPSLVAAEEEVEVSAPGKNLPILKCSRSSFETLIRDIQMPPDPLGMIRVRNFEYTFRALDIQPIVRDFQRFYQLSVSMGFFSFRQRDHTPKLMIPPGMTKWKTKFFYVKATAIAAMLKFRNVTGTIITENISVPKADTVDWFPQLRIIGWVKLDNRKARPMLREKSGGGSVVEDVLPRFPGEFEIVACADDEEGFNHTIRNNFRLPDPAALEAELSQGKGDLGALGDPAVTGVPKQSVLKLSDKHQRKMKKPHEAVVVPPLCQRWQGLSVLGGVMTAGGSTTGAEPVDVKKRKRGVPVPGGKKAPKLRKTWATAIPKPTPAVRSGKLIICYTSVVVPIATDRCALFIIENREEPVSLFSTPPSSPKVADVEVQKEGSRSPSIEVVNGGGTPPFVHAEETAKETVGGEKLKSPVVEKPSGSTAAGTRVEDQPSIQPGGTELEFYYRSYAVERGLDYHRPLWNVMQGDDVSNDASACREILLGMGTPFEVSRARGLPRQNRINQLSSMLETIRLRAEAEAMVKAAREGADQLKKDRAAFEKLKQTETWVASASLKQVRYFTKLLSDEPKGWREACARENEKLFRVRQELTNLKAANAELMKEKAAAEATAKEAETRGAAALKKAEARAFKVLEEADADRTKLTRLYCLFILLCANCQQLEVQSRVAILEEVSAHAFEAEARARQAEEVRDGLTTSLNQLTANRDWMRDHGIAHISIWCPFYLCTILDAPENATAVNEIKERARQAGFKVGYNECLTHVNPFFKSKFSDERSGFHGVDTEDVYAATVDAYNNLSISALDDIEKCLQAEDYVDRLRLLFDRPEEDEGAGGVKNDAGTSGTKAD